MMDGDLEISKLTADELRSLLVTVDYKGKVVKEAALAELEERAWQCGKEIGKWGEK